MSAGRICVAGVDIATAKHVRPVLNDALPAALLERNGGPFDVGNVVDVGNPIHCPLSPKFEDYCFEQSRAKKVGIANADHYWQLLLNISKDELSEIFGDQLVITDTEKAYLPQNSGSASLGCLIPLVPPEIFVDWEKLRVRVKTKFSGNVVSLCLSLTDIRLYQADHATPRLDLLEDLNRRMARGKVVLGVGVGHPVKFDPYPSAHWLQVNAIHLEDNPIWQLG